ncbi:hypothetical protein D3C71_1274370 [compost metagenome]
MNWRASSGTPVCSVTASASASDTAPRSPPHSITTLYGLLTLVPRRVSPSRGNSPKTTMARATRVATNTTATNSSSCQSAAAISLGISIAANRKIRELAQKPNCPQALARYSKVVGDMRVRPVEPTTRPAITVATTPDTFR